MKIWTRLGIAGTVVASVVGVSPVAPLGIRPAAAVSEPVMATECGPDGETVARLYRAYFDRAPDADGLLYWGRIANRHGLATVAYSMSQSPEYQARWSGTDDRTFVTELLYRNLLEREPDAEGLDYWVGLVGTVARDSQALHWVVQPEIAPLHPVTKPDWCAGFGRHRAIPGGRAVDVDWVTTDVSASRSRCPAASVNANWFYTSGPLAGVPEGLAVIDGETVPGSHDRNDFGILGERLRPKGPEPDMIDDWSGVTLRHTLAAGDGVALEHHHPWQPAKAEPADSGWRWAVAGISLIIDGQVWPGVGVDDSYTHTTGWHSFAAFRPPSTLTLGSTSAMNSEQLVQYFLNQGYSDLIALDGGGSVEMVEFGHITVGGTDRPVPVWLGINC